MIIIPMAGLSRRFSLAGYHVPKYQLDLQGRSVFTHAVESFSAMFESKSFLFIARPIAETEAFIRRECALLGIADARIAMLTMETAGQAETVERGLDLACISQDAPITIFNIDTFRSNFAFPNAPWFERSDGYLEVFRGSGDNWSYVAPIMESEAPRVERTAEKVAISDLCCDGLYHFARASDFRASLAKERQNPQSSELYIAPLYNHLIGQGGQIHYALIERECLTFCGIPDEYEALKRTTSTIR